MWGEEFRLLVCHNANKLKVTVLDKDMWNGQPIGWCEVSCLGLVDGEEELPVMEAGDKPCEGGDIFMKN